MYPVDLFYRATSSWILPIKFPLVLVLNAVRSLVRLKQPGLNLSSGSVYWENVDVRIIYTPPDFGRGTSDTNLKNIPLGVQRLCPDLSILCITCWCYHSFHVNQRLSRHSPRLTLGGEVKTEQDSLEKVTQNTACRNSGFLRRVSAEYVDTDSI